MTSHPVPNALRSFVESARRATMATIGPQGRPRLVPICFVLDEGAHGADRPTESAETAILYTAIDEKPKRSADPLGLARVRDILHRPVATVLVERWDEDWRRLAWVRLDCRAEIMPADEGDRAERNRAIAALRAKYPQYREQRLDERPLIRLVCAVGAAWGDLAAEDESSALGLEPDVEAM